MQCFGNNSFQNEKLKNKKMQKREGGSWGVENIMIWHIAHNGQKNVLSFKNSKDYLEQ